MQPATPARRPAWTGGLLQALGGAAATGLALAVWDHLLSTGSAPSLPVSGASTLLTTFTAAWLFMLVGLVVIPLARACALLLRRLPWPDAPTLLLALLLCGAAALGLGVVHAVLLRSGLEFTHYSASLFAAAALVALLLVGAAVTVAWPAWRTLVVPSAWLLRHGNTLFIQLLALITVTMAGRLARPLNEDGVLQPALLAAVALQGLVVDRLAVLGRGIVAPVAAVTVALVGCAASFHPHPRFVVPQHLALGSAAAQALQWLADVDRDGAGPRWLLGGDCAEGDAAVGPLAVDRPGDGVDQDCSGADALAVAPAAAVPPVPPHPWAGCLPSARDLSILLVTLDAVREDVLSPALTPAIAALIHQGTAFVNAYAPSTMTVPSLAALLTGQRVHRLYQPRASQHVELGEHALLQQRLGNLGWGGGAFNFFALAPLLAGFEAVNPVWADSYPHGVKDGFASATITRGALDFLREREGRKVFLWLHYPDAHAPYLVPQEVDFRPVQATGYAREVAYVDHHVGRLLTGLAALGRRDNTVVILTADHGESDGSRGTEGHGPTVYQDVVHVPLVVSVPGCPAGLWKEPVNVGHVVATLGAMLEQRWPGDAWGTSKTRALPVVVEAAGMPHYRRAVVWQDLKLVVDVRHGGKMLFDLAQDPDESVDVMGSHPAAGEVEEAYRRWLDAAAE